MENKITSVGIIGLGAFGKLCAQLVPKGIAVAAYDTKPIEDFKLSPLETAAQADIVILAVPLAALRGTLESIKDILPKTSVLVDICSVKVESSNTIKEVLPDHTNILVSHPLFGPQTFYNSATEKTFVVCEQHGTKAQEVIDFCKDSLGLTIVNMSPEEHDKEMSRIHALTFFVARALGEVHAEKPKLSTPSFEYLKKLIDLDHAHTQELFLTIQNGNPYAKQIRKDFVTVLQKIDATLEG